MHNAENERIKRRYFAFLREAKGHGTAAVDGAAKALSRFEADTKYRSFKAFRFEQAVAFKRRLSEQRSVVTGDVLSKATFHSTLTHLKRFFQWLAREPGYKSRFRYSDAEFFNAPEKDVRVATARRERPVPTIEQLMHTIRMMPAISAIERRDRAILAFILLTGARDSAVASMKLKHVDLVAGSVYQDARAVKTKNSKSFVTDFFPVGREILDIVTDWVTYLRRDLKWGNDDPLFPATNVAQGASRHFEVAGLKRGHWSTAAPIRSVFRAAFRTANLQYFNPHSVRNTLAQLGESLCRSPEEWKAWSQNLGHERVLTTLTSYGSVARQRQHEIIRSFADSTGASKQDVPALAKALVEGLRRSGQLE